MNGTFFLLISMLFLIACSDYQTKTFSIDGLDAQACEAISDSVFKRITLIPAESISNDWRGKTVADSTGKAFSLLQKDSVEIEADSSNFLLIAQDEADTTFTLMNVNGGKAFLYFDESIMLKIYAQSGEELSFSNNTISPETVGGCLELNENIYEPGIKTRLEYELSAGKYIFQLMKIDLTESSRIRFILLEQ